MNSMKIGTKFIVSLGCIAVVMILVGLFFIFHQEERRLHAMLEEQGAMVQAQVEVTRAYIAKNYVGKIKQSTIGSDIVVAREHGIDPQAIPFPATATQEIGKALGEKGIFEARLVSDQPMNPANAPKDTFERDALAAIMAGADSYSAEEMVNGVLTYRRASADKASVQACVTCHVGKEVGDLIGLLAVSMPMTSAKEGMMTSMAQTGGLLVSVILACVGLVYVLMQKFVLTPLQGLTQISRDIAQGQGDLTKRVPVHSHDEIGELARYFNLFIEKMHKSMTKVAGAIDRIASSATELSATAEQLSYSANGQNSRMVQSASAVEEMTMTAGEVARNSTEAARIAQETSETARTGHEVMAQTVSGMQQVSDAVGQSANIIMTLGKSSDQIGEIVRVIEDIADQTNLLALNAAIEAARAGEQGRGFAVVADEVRKLAERTTKATKEIGDMIRQIQQDTKSAVASMEDGTQRVMGGVELANKTGEALEKIQSMVNQTTSMIQQIADAAEEQSSATRQIASDLEAVAKSTKEASGGVSESAKASHDLSMLATELQSLIGTFRV
ncbi:MAG: methyl-accepting chemotaxis protein [Nitrospirales bacterium]|nr:methyl-accepting chemotaxis protein [Nitrospirales bacterium]